MNVAERTKKLRFWKHGTDGPGAGLSEERIVSDTSNEGAGSFAIYNNNVSLSIERQRQGLPVFKHRNNILYMVEKFKTLIIVGETGCGKSTQVPQYLLEAGWAGNNYVIAVTQPRRVATVTVARRVADERGVMLGDEVGYAVRFDDAWDENHTRIKFLTDGLLVREMMKDPLLTKYSVIMLDEAHERTLHTDIVIGLLRKIQKKRPALRIIIASATLDAEKFRDFFNDNPTKQPSLDTAGILTVEGNMYTTEIFYSSIPVPNYINATIETVMKIHHGEPPGDILAFLTGQEEVDTAVSMLIDEARKLSKQGLKMWVMPMYAALPVAEQMKVFQHTAKNTRKVVVATTIAEASITINGIGYVIDCGFVKLKAVNSKTSIESLVIVPVSQASAQQRAGRAGRVRSGKAYRLYTEDEFYKLNADTVPEMQRSNLAPVLLQLKALGIDKVLRFHFLSPPPAQNMVHGLELLYALGALDDNGDLTDPVGKMMAEFPLNPMYAKMLLSSGELGCSEEAVTIAAMIQIQNVHISLAGKKISAEKSKRKFSVEEGDHISLLNVYRSFIKNGQNSRWCHKSGLNYKGLCRALEIRNQLISILKRFNLNLKSCDDDVESVMKCITMGFFANAARLHYSGVYKTVRDQHELHIHPTSVLYTEKPPEWILYNEVVQTRKDYMRDVTVIKPEWLYELAPHYYQYGTESEMATASVKRRKLDD